MYRLLLTLILVTSTFAWAENPNSGVTGLERVSDCASDPANLIDDRAFMRRVWLDITGVIPEESVIQSFVNSNDPDKRHKMINLALNSSAFTDRWTNFFEEMFRSRYIFFFNPMFRNAFHAHIREMVAANTPWDEMAKDIIGYSGLGIGEQSSMTFYLTTFIDADFHLDFLDDQTTLITETMLGLKTDCISCHDGAYHLEEINKGLSVMTRQQFWELSAFLASSYLYLPYEALGDRGNDEAFFSQLSLVEVDDPEFELAGYLVAEEPYHTGEYYAFSEAGDGMRKPRNGGVVAPRYFRTGETPKAGETRRQALARMITADRQFARNMVNRVWAHMIGEGFVDPVDAWDLGRIDAETAEAFETTVQSRTPELMESLTDFFIEANYDIKELIRTIAQSPIYQWDYMQKQPCEDAYSYWRDDHRVRRLEAEAIYESYLRFLDVDFKYIISGIYDKTFHSTWQMPGTIEPNPYGLIRETDRGEYYFVVDPTELGFASVEEFFFQQEITLRMMRDLGRDDRLNSIPRLNESSIQLSLLLMNSPITTFFLEDARNSPYLQSMINRAESGGHADREFVINDMFNKALIRPPTPAELDVAHASYHSGNAHQFVTNLAWALVNHPDFVYK